MEAISARYKDTIMQMIKHSNQGMTVTSENVYQESNTQILPFIDTIIAENLEPGSEIRSIANLEKLAALAAGGSSCLLLLEHYSNFDLPIFSYLLRQSGAEGAAINARVLAIAGIKLSQTDPAVTAFTEAYSRLIIVPSRYLEIIKENIKDPKELVSEMMHGSSINHAAMKTLSVLKNMGKLILVFPAGTRYRPWDHGSKRGVREIDSYLKSFDYMCLISINGNILRINPEGEMKEDLLCRDKVILDVSPPIHCHEFREKAKHAKHFGEDKKQAIVDSLMASLEAMHEEVEKTL
ncbi:MAG: 1-acyl-sn-glycerol-3-phosphate acyltransferase [Spirochaetales bacterium]|nr:MAG: 1-acyl-sn-glycerol-3-phosphate acyltransferase [Spirochaetales bacterium]